MYLQITTKCNMSCDHCCYSCTSRGRHGEWDTVMQGIRFAAEWGESISIGGGEPTLHPDFWEILRECINRFDYVWMATNGSQTDMMWRLASIIQGEDYPEYECRCGPDDDLDDCTCWEYAPEPITVRSEEQFSVALSLDCFHDPIDPRVVDMWKRKAGKGYGSGHTLGFEIRDVTQSYDGIAFQGRAAKTGAGVNHDICVCSDLIIQPTGKVKLCGCRNAPVIGDVWRGIEDEWRDRMLNDGYVDTNCWRGLKKGERHGR